METSVETFLTRQEGERNFSSIISYQAGLSSGLLWSDWQEGGVDYHESHIILMSSQIEPVRLYYCVEIVCRFIILTEKSDHVWAWASIEITKLY